ncbi:hypothetical protein Ddye_004255 [Dipteronia dyeriana]|uniref:Uncharacterized protein n=1 Tax=Dipteronia dyeriana TaxID=168575 RepID=A0AAE0CW52_9ROSI|nr:hypothetical protein Ddye_004255 [Dipteronia dyeriana]
MVGMISWEPFLPLIAEKVIELSTHIDSDVKGKAPCIHKELKREELRFVQTLERGEKLLDQMLAEAVLSAQENGLSLLRIKLGIMVFYMLLKVVSSRLLLWR